MLKPLIYNGGEIPSGYCLSPLELSSSRTPGFKTQLLFPIGQVTMDQLSQFVNSPEVVQILDWQEEIARLKDHNEVNKSINNQIKTQMELFGRLLFLDVTTDRPTMPFKRWPKK